MFYKLLRPTRINCYIYDIHVVFWWSLDVSPIRYAFIINYVHVSHRCHCLIWLGLFSLRLPCLFYYTVVSPSSWTHKKCFFLYFVVLTCWWHISGRSRWTWLCVQLWYWGITAHCYNIKQQVLASQTMKTVIKYYKHKCYSEISYCQTHYPIQRTYSSALCFPISAIWDSKF